MMNSLEEQLITIHEAYEACGVQQLRDMGNNLGIYPHQESPHGK